MKKKLKIKFILIAMIPFSIILFLIVGSVNIAIFHSAEKFGDVLIEKLIENDGSLDNVTFSKNDFGYVQDEAKYDVRYFIVTKINDNYEVDLSHISTMDEEYAIAFSENILSSGEDSGYYYEYRYEVIHQEEQTTIYYVKCYYQFYSARYFCKMSIILSLVGLVGVFILSCILAELYIPNIEKNQEKQKKFISNVGHELKTPLTIISVNNDLLEMENGNHEAITSNRNQIIRLKNIINGMTLLSNIDEKKKSYHLKKFILNDTIISCCSFYQEDFNKINIKINLSLNENVLINGNEQLVWEMLSCILDNCKKYATSYVNISLSKYKRKYILLISNDSTFVKDGNLDICFEKFYRLDESHNSSIEGSGIGLSIVKEIANFHHFKISAYGLKGTFNIKIIFHNKLNNG